MSMHTLEPWVIVTNRYGQPDHIVGENGPLSGVVCSFGVKVKRTCTLAEVKANARLIAAAPELLAELQNIANANPRTWPEDVRDQFQQWAQSRARAAIAKATGEQK